MTGLREKKKERTRAQIIEAAAVRLGTHGLQATTMEEIAAGAEVSVGTLYNYFGSKTALLVALFEAEVGLMLEQGARTIEHIPADPVTAVEALYGSYLDVIFSFERKLLREVLAAGLTGGAELAADFARIDGRLVEQLNALLDDLAGAGVIDRGTDLEDAALALFSILMTQLLIYASLDDVAPPAVRHQVSRQLAIVWSGLEPKEE